MPLPLVTPAIVLSCRGAPIGDLNLVRSLGREGVPVSVIAEYDAAPTLRSRYARESYVLPRFTRDPNVLRQFLLSRAAQFDSPPVLIANCDSDLAVLDQLRGDLGSHYRIAIPSTPLIEMLGDKQRF